MGLPDWHSKDQWYLRDFVALVGLTPRALRYHRRKLSTRPGTEPFPSQFPLPPAQAARFYEYLANRSGQWRKKQNLTS